MKVASTVFLVCLMTSLAMAQNPKPPTPLGMTRDQLPKQDAVVLSVVGKNLTIFVDTTSSPDDQDRITTLEIKWQGEGGFDEQGCNFDGPFTGDFDVCRPDKIAKVRTRGVGGVWDAGDIMPDNFDPDGDGWLEPDVVAGAELIVDGSFLTGGTLDRLDPDSPYIAAVIPEPSSLALLALGSLGLIGVRRRF